jgi:hypothetical protein
LTKGFGAGIFLLALAPLLIKWRSFARVHAVLGAVTAGVMGAPWFLYMYSEFGQQFVNQIFVEQVLGRVEGGNVGGTFGGDPTFALMNFPYFK